MITLIEGSLLAVVVVFLFLRDWRATTISALAIPLSAIPTFAFMYWFDFTLNGVSLLALSLVAGVLVDDAIVEIENIVRHMRMGKTGFQAALDAADEIGLAVVATSATIIAVFLPVSFMSGIVGQYFKQFGLTVAAAVFFSLLVARLITPVIAAYTLRPDSLPHHTDGPVMTWYMNFLNKCIHHRWHHDRRRHPLLRTVDRCAGPGAEVVHSGRRHRQLGAADRDAAGRASRRHHARVGRRRTRSSGNTRKSRTSSSRSAAAIPARCATPCCMCRSCRASSVT